MGWIDVDAAKVLRRLRHCGYTAYLVGGCVRDLLLGRYPKDFDIATSALPREVKRAFSNCRLIGRRFRLAHIIFQNSIVEVATFRREPGAADAEEEDLEDSQEDWFPQRRRRASSTSGEAGEGVQEELASDLASALEAGESAGELSSEDFESAEAAAESELDEAEPDVELEETVRDEEEAEDLLIRSDNVFGTPREDATRRDFTINALFYDISSMTLIDWVGGLHDIEARVIRTIGVPETRFKEDPIRMLRAIKFAASLRFTIEPRTWAALCQVGPDINRSAPPRILEEIFRMMKGGASQACFRLLALSDLLSHILPELEPLVQLELATAATSASPLHLRVGGPDVAVAVLPERAHLRQPPEDEGLESGAERPEVAGVLGYLRVLDQLDQIRTPLPNHLLLAILCVVPVFRMVTPEGDSAITDQVFRKAGFLLEELGARLRVARRDRERARLVLLGLTKLLWRSERGSSVSALSRKSYFPESLLLYGLHNVALGRGLLDLRRLTRRLNLTPDAQRVLEILSTRLEAGGSGELNDEGRAAGLASAPADRADEPGSSRRRRRRRSRRRRGDVGAAVATGESSPEAPDGESEPVEDAGQ